MYAQFSYVRPKTVEELLEFLREKTDDTALYGGGTDILVDLRSGKRKFTSLVDVKGVEAFGHITETEDCISIGCAVTLSEIATSPLVAKWAPALAQGAAKVGCVQIRNKGTLAGNIQTASPAGDGFNAAFALDGVAVLQSVDGRRRIPLQQYATGPRHTCLGDHEILAFVEIPKRHWSYETFFKVGMRNALAISVVNGVVAVALRNGIVQDARISVGSVAPTPLRVLEAEQLLRGEKLTSELAACAGQIVANAVHPISDLRASAEYRAYMAGTMVKKQLEVCREECGE